MSPGRGAVADVAECIPAITDQIVHTFRPLEVVLFGSRARGDARPDSDLDLLVVLPSVEDKQAACLQIGRSLSHLSVAADLIVTTPEEIRRRGALIGPILRPALREGKVLYAKRGWHAEPGMSDEERLSEVRSWLRWAEEDLQGAESTLADVIQGRAAPRQACFWAQQSAEKAVKAALIFEQIDYPRIHDVARLAELMPAGWQAVKAGLPDLGALSAWAVQARYPDASRDATLAEGQAALDQAKAVWQAISEELERRGIS